jgi:hypothetical protein
VIVPSITLLLLLKRSLSFTAASPRQFRRLEAEFLIVLPWNAEHVSLSTNCSFSHLVALALPFFFRGKNAPHSAQSFDLICISAAILWQLAVRRIGKDVSVGHFQKFSNGQFRPAPGNPLEICGWNGVAEWKWKRPPTKQFCPLFLFRLLHSKNRVQGRGKRGQ